MDMYNCVKELFHQASNVSTSEAFLKDNVMSFLSVKASRMNYSRSRLDLYQANNPYNPRIGLLVYV